MTRTLDKIRLAVQIRATKWRDEDMYAIQDYSHIPILKTKFGDVSELKKHLKEQHLKLLGAEAILGGKEEDHY